MATIQLGNTKVANKLLSYAEKRAEEREGIDCPPDYAKAQFKATRELWGKTGGIQAHHVIQSFVPGEVTPGVANEIGQELARKIAKGHEVVVYTHTDKAHIHNHIVINAVSYEDGRKYQSSKKDLYKIREKSDALCVEKGLSIVEEPSAKVRYTLAEKALMDKGKDSWKDEIRDVIDLLKEKVKSVEDLAKKLKNEFEIETKITTKNISFKHPDVQKFVRGKTLGLAYEKESLSHEFEVKNKRIQERGTIRVLPGNDKSGGNDKNNGGNEGIKQSSKELYRRRDRQGRNEQSDNSSRVAEDKRDERNDSTKTDFDINKARKHAENARRNVVESFGEWQEGNETEQRKDPSKNGGDRENVKQQHEQSEARIRQQFLQLKAKDRGLDR